MRFALLALALVVPGCTVFKVHASGSKPIALNQIETATTFRSFEVSRMRAFDYTGSIDLGDMLRNSNEVNLGDQSVRAVQNVRVEIGSSFGTFLANFFTLFLANAIEVRVKGDVIEAAPR